MVIQTPIGELFLSASVHGRELAADEALFKHMQLEPCLPPGMTVDLLEAVLVVLKPRRALNTVKITCKWISVPGAWSDQASGEGLDAQSWVVDNKLVFIGTEDLDSLTVRLTEHGLLKAPYPIKYSNDGFEIVLPQIPASRITSLHFIVASTRLPEPLDCSAWYAVDVAHEHVLAAAGKD